jgi:hypothetical protein
MPGPVEPAKNGSGDAWLDCRFAVESVCPICHVGATTLPFLPALESLRIKVIEDLPGPVCVQSQVTAILPHFENARASSGNVKACAICIALPRVYSRKDRAYVVFPSSGKRRNALPTGGAVICCRGGIIVSGEGPDKGGARKAPLTAPPSATQRAPFPWPWGLVAIGVMGLAWIGIYLIWNGVVFVLGL